MSKKEFCVYITFYSGNKMPPFYIGHTRTEKFLSGKYFGSVGSKTYGEIFKSELKNNPHLFKAKIITQCDTRLDALEKETYFQRFHNAHINELFINKSIAGEKFVNTAHKPHSKETYARMSKMMSGEGNPMFGMKGKLSPRFGKAGAMNGKQHTGQTKQLMSEKSSGENNGFYGHTHSEEQKKKWSVDRKGENNHATGNIWITNGVEQKYVSPNSAVPNGWYIGVRPKSDTFRKQQADRMRGKKWMVNNDNICKSIPLADVDKYISNGWKMGRKLR